MSIGLACAFAARPALAEPKLDGAVQLSLSGSVLGYSSLTVTLDQSQPSPAGAGSLAPEPSLTTTHTSYGLPGAGSGFGLGVGLSDSVVLGAQLLFSRSNTSMTGTSTDASTLQFLPRLEYVFDDSNVRPFFAAVAGIGHTSETSSGSSSFGAANYTAVTESSSTTYLFGGSLGVHGFLSDTFSIDPAVTVLGVSGSQTSNSPSSGDSGSFQGGSFQEAASISGYQVMFSIGLSGWLGGSSPRPPEPWVQAAPAVQAPPTTQAAPQPAPAPAPAPQAVPPPQTVPAPAPQQAPSAPDPTIGF